MRKKERRRAWDRTGPGDGSDSGQSRELGAYTMTCTNNASDSFLSMVLPNSVQDFVRTTECTPLERHSNPLTNCYGSSSRHDRRVEATHLGQAKCL